ncbi:MAG: DUF4870 domain-containing protein [Acidobacteriota bacterium]|nr:DUF4870 domain-containing protein [Acidobacteriota bacterium]
MTLTEELLKLQQLRESGALTEEEFRRAKEKLMSEDASGAGASRRAPRTTQDMERETRKWALSIHLSQFAHFVFPLGGIILPIVLWQLKKDELPGVDAHGRAVLNWAISSIIYAVICILLCFLLIGIPMLVLLGLAAVAFPIIGAIKANDGLLWKYPASIQFFNFDNVDAGYWNNTKGF